MQAFELIRKKRDGMELSRQETESLVHGYLRENLEADDFLAFLEAAWDRGLSRAETEALTAALVRPEETLEWPGITFKKISRRSTGGVGDNTSMMVASIVAAGGVAAPLFAGRGLGHIGGMLDKLESLPGFRVDFTRDELLQTLQRYDCFIASQQEHLAQAQRKLDALCTLTAAAGNPALLCLTVMSKELAAGVDGMLIDVKVGTGALIRSMEDARKAAQLMVSVGECAGRRVVAFITDMDQPIGRTIGNALEIGECADLLREQRDPRSEDVRELSIQMAGWIFFMAEKVTTVEDGRRLALELLIKGRASAHFRRMIITQGGDAAFWLDTKHLRVAEKHYEIKSPSDGFLAAVDCYKIGVASQKIGAGRETPEDTVDPAVGIELYRKPGDPVARGDTIFRLYYNDAARLEEARKYLEGSFTISRERAPMLPLVREVLPGANLPAENPRIRRNKRLE